MSLANNYRTFTATLVRGVDFLTAKLGERWSGTYALIQDLLMTGATYAFHVRLPGHPNQPQDALNQSGADAGLFRYRGESLASWTARVKNPWPLHEQAGTDIDLLRELDVWGAIVFPATWVAGQCYLIESQWAAFTLFIPTGLVSWAGPTKYGSGHVYGENNLLFGVTALSEDVATLRRIMRLIKPSRSKASAVIIISGVVYGQHGVVYGAAHQYGAVVVRFTF